MVEGGPMTLRMRVVEAVAEVFRDADHLEPFATSYARAALDAMLDCLTENADEWFELWTMGTDGDPRFVNLLVVLRDD